jgi:hypothetical protein
MKELYDWRKIMIKNLKLYCVENSINCSTCKNSFKNYHSETEYIMICLVHEYYINDYDICIDWKCWLNEKN